MSRNYPRVRPKVNQVYSVDNVLALYSICRNTLSNWIASGLKPSDARTPQVFGGAELVRFHNERTGTKTKLRPGQFKCLGCGNSVFPDVQTVEIRRVEGKRPLASAVCPDCTAMVLKLLNETNCDAFQKCIDTNTNLASIDEAEADTPVGIGKDALGVSEPTRSPNDRIILKWQEYARRYDPKTVEAHLYAIRSLERFHQQKPFRDLTIADVAAWRDDLLNNVDLSRSTIRHRASHVRAFLDWLSKQEGHRSLAPLSDYLELPRKFHQRKPQEQRAYPTLKEAEIMLGEMSSSTLKERRDRALVACAYVSGFRADALVSLRLRHVDVANRLVFHDGQEIRAKNGKTFTVFWFPRTESFQKILVDWVNEVQRLGFGPDDALFPELAKLESACQTDRAPIDPMTSSAAVTQAFKIASDAIGKSYSPHSVRDSLAHLRDEICRTPEQRKAFSANLGHSSEKVTETYYGKVDDQRREEIFRAFDNAPEATNEELELLVAYHERELIPGSPEFNRARAASRAWQMRRR